MSSAATAAATLDFDGVTISGGRLQISGGSGLMKPRVGSSDLIRGGQSFRARPSQLPAARWHQVTRPKSAMFTEVAEWAYIQPWRLCDEPEDRVDPDEIFPKHLGRASRYRFESD